MRSPFHCLFLLLSSPLHSSHPLSHYPFPLSQMEREVGDGTHREYFISYFRSEPSTYHYLLSAIPPSLPHLEQDVADGVPAVDVLQAVEAQHHQIVGETQVGQVKQGHGSTARLPTVQVAASGGAGVKDGHQCRERDDMSNSVIAGSHNV